MIRYYVLDANGKPHPEPDELKWAYWFFDKETKRHVGSTNIGGSWVSTVFLGIDIEMAKRPLLWETMVFGGKLDRAVNRCSGSKEQAEAMHAEMVERVEAIEALGIQHDDTQRKS